MSRCPEADGANPFLDLQRLTPVPLSTCLTCLTCICMICSEPSLVGQVPLPTSLPLCLLVHSPASSINHNKPQASSSHLFLPRNFIFSCVMTRHSSVCSINSMSTWPIGFEWQVSEDGLTDGKRKRLRPPGRQPSDPPTLALLACKCGEEDNGSQGPLGFYLVRSRNSLEPRLKVVLDQTTGAARREHRQLQSSYY